MIPPPSPPYRAPCRIPCCAHGTHETETTRRETRQVGCREGKGSKYLLFLGVLSLRGTGASRQTCFDRAELVRIGANEQEKDKQTFVDAAHSTEVRRYPLQAQNRLGYAPVVSQERDPGGQRLARVHSFQTADVPATYTLVAYQYCDDYAGLLPESPQTLLPSLA